MSRTLILALGAAPTLVLATSCGLVFPVREPPPARGVVLVLAAGYGGALDARRTPALARLRAEGRAFEAAFAPDPDAAAARAAVVDGPLAPLLRTRGVSLAGLGDALALPIDSKALDLRLAGTLSDPDTTAGLEAWLRARRDRFVLFAAVGAPARGGGPSPATLAGAFAPPLPRIALGDLAFSDRPGGERRPAAWSEPARQRAEATQLERAIAADRELATLVALVERTAPGTATIVVGDALPDQGRHGHLERGDALFDDRLRSTLVIATPGMARPGRVSPRLVSTLDVIPTLLSLAGLSHEPGLAGRSLMPLLADPSAEGRSEVVSSVRRRAGRLGRSLRSERFRYSEWPDGSRELYDHDADPGEHTNLAGRPEHAATIAGLEHTLAEPRATETLAAPQPPRTTLRPRNVVLIVVDDLNTRVGVWGAPVKTPSIDRLAARGVRFDRAYAQVAMCSPSRVSMLTGWRPERTGVWQNEDPPRPARAVPLQELFAAHGAVTAAIGKIYHSPTDFRWDLPEVRLDEPEEHPDVVETSDPSASSDPAGALWLKAPGRDADQPDGRRARRAVALIERQGTRPFFLALGLVRPHLRWIAPARYFDLYPPERVALTPFPEDDLADVPAIAVKTQPQPLPGLRLLGREPPGLLRDPDARRRAISAYQACVTFVDAQLGLVLDALDRNHRWKDTIVVLVGDNGFHLGEHGGLLRKDTLFEEALRVPLIVAAPGLPHPGAVVKAPVELLDVYPTIVELAGLTQPPGLDGQSLVRLLESPEGAGRGVARSWRRVQPPERGASLRTERFRYTLWPDGSEELYDGLQRSPESENLAMRPEWSVEKARLRARLEALVAPLAVTGSPPG